MANQLRGYDEMVECPYNRAHQILAGRIQFHLVKCRKSYPNAKVAICPFDQTHVVPKEELDIHVRICPKRENVERYRFAISTIDDAMKQGQKRQEEELKKLLEQKEKEKQLKEQEKKPANSTKGESAASVKDQAKLKNTDEEDWSSYNVPTYDPQAYVVNAPVLRTLIGAQPSQRKAFAKAEYKRLSEFRRKP